MKHNFTAWRYLDPAPAEVKGGAILEAIKENQLLTTTQIESVKTAHQKALDDTKGEIKKDIADLDTRVGEAKSAGQKALEKAEDIEKKMATSGMNGTPGATQSIFGIVEESLTKNKEKLPLSVKGKFGFELNVKAVGNMGSSANLTGSYFVAPTVVPGVITSPYNEVHLRNLLPTGTTDSNVVRHIRDLGGEGGPAMVAEAGSKPQMDRDFSIIDANVRKLATHLRVPEEMIEDIPWLTSFITEIGVQEVLAVEDTQILYGDGTGQNLFRDRKFWKLHSICSRFFNHRCIC
jgi:HK97 family phage major capsid protein